MLLHVYRCNRCGVLLSLTQTEFSHEKHEEMESNPCRVCERGKGQIEYCGVVWLGGELPLK